MYMNNLKSPELDAMLGKAHQQLKALNIPVAPLSKIQIEYRKTLKKLPGICWKYDDGDSYLIGVSYGIRNEPEPKRNVYAVVMHEVLHTAFFEHDDDFLTAARLVRQQYKINLLNSIPIKDYQYSHQEPYKQYVCDCGCEISFYSREEWQAYEDIRPGYLLNYGCLYCSHKLKERATN